MTLAPEVDDVASATVMMEGKKKGITFFIGHSAADALKKAANLATGWTHLGNAAPAEVPKFDNVIMRALGRTDLYASLIPDGLHVPEYAFRVLAHSLQRRQPPRLLLTTDAMAAAGAVKTGRYTLGEVQVEVSKDGSARLPGSGRLAARRSRRSTAFSARSG